MKTKAPQALKMSDLVRLTVGSDLDDRIGRAIAQLEEAEGHVEQAMRMGGFLLATDAADHSLEAFAERISIATEAADDPRPMRMLRAIVDSDAEIVHEGKALEISEVFWGVAAPMTEAAYALGLAVGWHAAQRLQGGAR
jgi:hypothetical protein